MRSKASLVLMEQLVMVLVFALAAAVCLGIFGQSSRIAENTARQEAAALLAGNAAAYLKAERSCQDLETGDLTLEVEALPSPVPGYLNQAQIRVLHEGELLYTLVTGWQEVGG